MKNSFLNGADAICNFSWERGWLEGFDHFGGILLPSPKLSIEFAGRAPFFIHIQHSMILPFLEPSPTFNYN